MTTKEFIKAVDELGYETKKDNGWILIKYKEIIIACIFTKELYRMSSSFSYIDCGENAGTLFALIFQYACTPVEDRELKKYRIFLKLIPDSNFKYLCKRCGSIDELKLDVESNIYSKFTQKEIDKIKEKYGTTLADFKIIEVGDED